MARRKPKQRKRRDGRGRFKTASVAQRQLEEIEHAQAEEGHEQIASIEKSKQRFRNSLKRIHNADDAHEQFS
jgi:hypothetical protein